MSNQVYSSDIRKYYDFPGINSYGLLANVAVPVAVSISAPGSAELEFITTFRQDDNTCYDSFNGLILRDGMYNFTVNVEVTAQNTNIDINYNITPTLSRPGIFTNLKLGSSQQRIPAKKTSSGIDNQIISLSNTVYCKAGDILTYTIYNYMESPSPPLLVETAYSQLLVSKIL